MATSCSPAPSASPAGSADSPWSWQSPAARPPPCRPARCAAGRPARSSCARPTPHSTRVPPGSVPRSAPSPRSFLDRCGLHGVAEPKRDSSIRALQEAGGNRPGCLRPRRSDCGSGTEHHCRSTFLARSAATIEHTAARQVFHPPGWPAAARPSGTAVADGLLGKRADSNYAA